MKSASFIREKYCIFARCFNDLRFTNTTFYLSAIKPAIESMKFNLSKRWIFIYGITIIAFIIYVCFLADFSLLKQRELNKKIETLDNKITAIDNNINNTSTFEEISSNPKLLEKYAREQLNMQKENEDVFIIVHK